MSTAQKSPVLRALERAVDKLTPLALADTSWDNVGLMIEAPFPRKLEQGQKGRVVLCIDLTTQVCDAALADPQTVCVLTYHPPIFSGLKSVTLKNPLQKSLLKLSASGVSVFCNHTAADNALGGVNDFMGNGLIQVAQKLSGKGQQSQGSKCEPIKVEQNPPEGHDGSGTGRLVTLGSPMSKEQVADAVKDILGRKYIQAAWSAQGEDEVRTIAICAGSGESVLRGVKADLYLTGELGHHYILSFNASGIHCLVCNHSATERPWLKTFAPSLEHEMNVGATESSEEFEVVVSEVDREPLEVV
ncbi:hypothetical protein OIO90_003873 [Microbotryomycetes sp. JL221]|nr:hypothetical protein OIO90_003873 [Microbotryomycetes sp. JL221]